MVATLVDPASPETSLPCSRARRCCSASPRCSACSAACCSRSRWSSSAAASTPPRTSRSTRSRPVLGRLDRQRALSRGSASLIWDEKGADDLQESYRALRTNLEFLMDETTKRDRDHEPRAGAGQVDGRGQPRRRVQPASASRRSCSTPTCAARASTRSSGSTTAPACRRCSRSGARPSSSPPAPGLWVITSGPVPPDPTEMLHIRLPSVIKALRRRKALILIDTPPVLPVSDARLVAPLADGVILVGDRGHAEARELPGRARPARAGRQPPDGHHPQQGRRGRPRRRHATTATRRPGRPRSALEPERPPARREPPRPPQERPSARRSAARRPRATGGAGLGARAAARQPRRIPGGGARRHPAWATPPRCGPCTRSPRSPSVGLVLMTLLRVEFLLLVLTAALPWEGALGIPVRGRLGGQDPRRPAVHGLAAARDGPLRAAAGEPGAGMGRLLPLRGPALDAVRARPGRQRVRRAALPAVRRVLLPRAAAHPHDRGRPQGRARLRAVVHPRGRLGPLRLHRARPRTRRGADRRPQRLRLPDGLRAAAGVLPARRGEAPAVGVGHLLPAAGRRHVRDPVARRLDRARSPRRRGPCCRAASR